MELRDVMGDLVGKLKSYKKNIQSTLLFPIDAGISDPELRLYYKPGLQTVGQGHEKRVQTSGGEFAAELGYNGEKVEDVLQGFLRSSSLFQEARELLARTLGGVDSHTWEADLYITLFCNHLWTTGILDAGPKASTTNFIASIQNRNYLTTIRVALDGISSSSEELLLDQDDVERTSLRQPRTDDFPRKALVAERWDSKFDPASQAVPSFSHYSSSILIESRQIRIVPLEIPVRFYSRLWIVEWLVQAIRLRVNELRTILDLFQSKTRVVIPYIELKFFMKENSSGDALYTLRIPWEKTGFWRDPFVITDNNKESLQSFWKRMRQINILQRAHHLDDYMPHRRSYSPTQLAFHDYYAILSSSDDSVDRIHDAIEAIEGLFTPEKFATKLFIRRVTDLIELLGIDPNNTYRRLSEAWQVRSEYSHHGKGWDEQQHLDIDEDTREGQESIRHVVDDQNHLQDLAKLILNYLRICILARFEAALDEREFISLLETDQGKQRLKVTLNSLPLLVSGDPLIQCIHQSNKVGWYEDRTRYWRFRLGGGSRQSQSTSMILADWLMRCYIATGQHRNESLDKKFEEIRPRDLVALVADNYLWAIAKVRSKNGKPHARQSVSSVNEIPGSHRHKVSLLKVTRVKDDEFPEHLRKTIFHGMRITELSSDDWIALTNCL